MVADVDRGCNVESPDGDRIEATAGLRQRAEAKVAQAEQRSVEYQNALRAARSELYRIQEKERQGALEKRAEVVQLAQQQAAQQKRARQ